MLWPREHIQMPTVAHLALCNLTPADLSTLFHPSLLLVVPSLAFRAQIKCHLCREVCPDHSI